MMVLAALLVVLVLLIVLYFVVIRPWQLRWGATDVEVGLALPGDTMVAKPDFNATRAIPIVAAPELVWRWLIQLGSRRAGWYSIDWIDNGGVKSATEILTAFQQIAVGQFIPFTPNQQNGMWVKEFVAFRYILWADQAGRATWLWYLAPTTSGEIRLLTRLRTKYDWRSRWIVYYLLYDVGDILLMSTCLKGIKRRAEKEQAALASGR